MLLSPKKTKRKRKSSPKMTQTKMKKYRYSSKKFANFVRDTSLSYFTKTMTKLKDCPRGL